MYDCVTSPPLKAGSYNVAIDGIMPFMPIFWDYDGECWHPDSWLRPDELTAGKAAWFPNAES